MLAVRAGTALVQHVTQAWPPGEQAVSFLPRVHTVSTVCVCTQYVCIHGGSASPKLFSRYERMTMRLLIEFKVKRGGGGG